MNSRKRKRSRISMAQKFRIAVRIFLYALLILIAFVTASSGNHVKPLLLIPTALCIASSCKDVPAVIVGILCGFLIDISCGKLLGFNAILLLIFCLMTSLLYTHLLQQRLFNLLALTAICSLIQTGLDFFFFYAIWGYDHVNLIFRAYALPCWIATTLSAVPIYFLGRLVIWLSSPRKTGIARSSTR